MEMGISTSEVAASPDMGSREAANSKALYDIGILLMYGGGMGLVAFFLFN